MRRITGLVGEARSGPGLVLIFIWVVVIAVVLYVLVILVAFIGDGFQFQESPPLRRG